MNYCLNSNLPKGMKYIFCIMFSYWDFGTFHYNQYSMLTNTLTLLYTVNILEIKKLMSFSDEEGLKDIVGIYNTMYQQTESQKVVEYSENSDHQWMVEGYPSGM